MILVHVYVRHSTSCKHKKNSDWKQCRCPKHFHWHHGGKLFRQSAHTRSWASAQQKARAIELKFEQAELGQRPAKDEAVTVEKAVAQYLIDKRSQQLAEDTLEKLDTTFRKQMLSWTCENGIHFMVDFTLPKLQQFRSSWPDGALAASKKQERVRGFFRFAQANGWISTNPAIGLSRIKVEQKPTDYFTKAEYKKIIDATYIYNQKSVQRKESSNNATRLRALIELMRWSGLAIRDASTLERSRLDHKNNLFLYRAKTGVPVYLPLPASVAKALRQVPPGPKPNSRYFFWSGNGDPKSTVGDWQRAFAKLFQLADIKHPDGKAKRCHPHMLRDTFAVECLLAGMSLQDVSLYLGHSSIKTTEKHYAPFVKARQEQMVRNMKTAWLVMRKK
jgi:integrase